MIRNPNTRHRPRKNFQMNPRSVHDQRIGTKRNVIGGKKASSKFRIFVIIAITIIYGYFIYGELDNYFYFVNSFTVNKPFFKWLAMSGNIAVFSTLYYLALVVFINFSKFNSMILLIVGYAGFVIWDYANHNIESVGSPENAWLYSMSGSRDLIALFVLCVLAGWFILKGRRWD